MSNIKSSYRSPRLLSFKVDGTGTAKLTGADASFATLTDNGTGDYTITLADAASEISFAVAMPLTDDVSISKQAAHTTSIMRFECRGIERTATQTFDSALKIHSNLAGADGNDITIQFADAVSAGSEAIASVSDAGVIVVNIEGGVSTATQVHAALVADSALGQELSHFISSEVLVGATAISTAAATNLADGVDGGAVDCDFDVLAYISEA